MLSVRSYMPMSTVFEKKVYAALKRIPRGKVTTYARLAKAIGSPNAARAVGNALGKNQKIGQIPCHRVVRADGSLGGFALGKAEKVKYISREGVIVRNGKIADFRRRLFDF